MLIVEGCLLLVDEIFSEMFACWSNDEANKDEWSEKKRQLEYAVCLPFCMESEIIKLLFLQVKCSVFVRELRYKAVCRLLPNLSCFRILAQADG